MLRCLACGMSEELMKSYPCDNEIGKSHHSINKWKALDSAGVKDDSDKLRFDLIPARPMEELARIYTIGARKYADRNWEKGLKWSRVFGAMLRHAWAFWRGEDNDPETGVHHMASVAWCALALIEYGRTKREFDDRVKEAT